jgi:predicted Ser/Thr protein kinase
MAPDETTIVEPILGPDDEEEFVRAALKADYEILEELGRGGMAVVYRAVERALAREVAIKVLPLVRTFDDEFVQRFQREARLSASLEHPHIIPIYRVGQAGRVNFIVMKYISGPSVSELLADQGQLKAEEVEKMVIQVSEALDRAHGMGIVHRDIKPDNIMTDKAGRFVVMDFGIAKSLSDTKLTQTAGSIGTPRYMSPEQGRAGLVDGRSDLYSLGVVAYQCLVGHPPFEGEDTISTLYSHQHDPVPEPTLRSDRERRVYSVIRHLLAKSPDDRPQTGADVETLFTPTVAAPPTSGPKTASVTHGPRTQPTGVLRWLQSRTRRSWAAIGVGAILLIAVFGRDGAAARCRAALPDAAEDDRTVILGPIGTVARGADIDLSYIACGLPAHDVFEARLTIGAADRGGVIGGLSRLFGGGDDPVRLTWNDEADGFATSRSRTIKPGDLEAGSYRLTVRIAGSSGRDFAASHEFAVVDP